MKQVRRSRRPPGQYAKRTRGQTPVKQVLVEEMLDLEVVGQGATTKIYRDGNIAIKLYVNTQDAWSSSSPSERPDQSDAAANEAERQRFAYNAGLPVPAVYGVRKLSDNAVALDMEYINGRPLIQLGMDKDERRNAIHILANLQCKVHNIHAIGLPNQVERIAWKIKSTKHLDNPLKDKLLSLLMNLDDGFEWLCHGDFHPLNILYDGSKHWIIDWVDTTAGNPLADACRTYLIFMQYMNRLAGIYLNAFCKESKSKKDDVLAWLPVVAAARLNENMDDKSRAWLINMVKDINYPQ